jgi:pyrroline-5-carboxylate reductase
LNADIIVLAILPQQINSVLEEITETIDSQKQVINSGISGVTCSNIKDKLFTNLQVVRVMRHTPIAIQQSMTSYATDNATAESLEKVKEMFDTVGVSIKIQEDLITSATALCTCGIVFFLRSARATCQGGVEVGFHANDAIKMASQTAKGAADSLLQLGSHPEREID